MNSINIKISMFFVALMFSSFSWAGFNPVSGYKGAEVHKKYEKTFDQYELHYGPMEYFESVGRGEEEGYLPKKSVMLMGESNSFVYDHTKEDSALDIIKNIKNDLQRKGYETLYYCERESCGYIDGWKFYISEEIGGDVEAQYYLVSRNKSLNNNDEYIVFYVSDIDVRPRSILHLIKVEKSSLSLAKSENKKVYNSSELAEKLEMDGRVEVSGIFFDFDSAVLKSESAQALSEISKMLRDNVDAKLYVVGHSDSIGEIGYNLKLSKQRASSVINHLVSIEKTNEKRLEAYGIGPLSPIDKTNGIDSRSKNRRVEIILQ